MNPKYYKIYDNSVENPFENYKIDDNSFLDKVQDRSICSKCRRSRKYFCYTCNLALPDFQDRVPKVKLPIKIDIIKHERETEGKSTSVHAAIIAPDDVKVYIYPHDIPDYTLHNEKTILIYPSKDSMELKDYIAKLNATCSDLSEETTSCVSKNRSKKLCVPFDRAVFIDATWPQSRSIMAHSTVKHLPCITLQRRVSYFWRHQKNSPRWFLATIEAIHQLLYEVDPNHLGQYDNLLFFFEFMYRKIHSLYNHDQLLAYHRKMNLTFEPERVCNKSPRGVTIYGDKLVYPRTQHLKP